jgi:DNA-binding PadR family transcriptional regulator
MNRKIYTHNVPMCKSALVRRKAGALVPLELAILEVASARPHPVHGFELAKLLADVDGSRRLTAHGTLYKALGRLADAGLLEAEWEDAGVALAEGRPRRRLYRITGEGARRLAAECRSTVGLDAVAGLA